MARPLCSTMLERASIRSSAAAAASPLRGGVRNRRSARLPASSGNSRREAAKRTFVLIWGRAAEKGMAIPFLAGNCAQRLGGRGVASEQRLERSQGASPGLRITEQAAVVVHDQRDAEHLERDLLGVGIGQELALIDALAHAALQRLGPGALAAGEHVTHRAGLVVEFGRAAEHGT